MLNDLQTSPSHPDPPRQPLSESELAIVSTIKTYTETQTATLSEVTNTLASPIEALYTTPGLSRSADARLWKLYTCAFRYARTIPDSDGNTQNRLVDIISNLKSRPEPHPPTLALNTRQGQGDLLSKWGYPSLWDPLVLFGAVGREQLDEQPGTRNSVTSLEEETEEWTSLHAFLCTIDGEGGAWFLGVWILGDARCGGG